MVIEWMMKTRFFVRRIQDWLFVERTSHTKLPDPEFSKIADH